MATKTEKLRCDLSHRTGGDATAGPSPFFHRLSGKGKTRTDPFQLNDQMPADYGTSIFNFLRVHVKETIL